jgi:integrase
MKRDAVNTDKQIEKLKAEEKKYSVRVGDARGLYVRVTPNGVKTYVAVARDPKSGKQVWATIGETDLKIDDAKDKARGAIKRIKAGLPPFEDSEEPADTFKAVAENFIKRYVDKRGLRSKGEIERQLNTYVYPVWGKKSFTEITRRDVAKLLDNLEDNSGATTADRVLATIRKICNWHETRDDRYVSPVVRGMARTKPAERKRSRVLSDDEIRDLWPHLTGTFGAMVKTLLLTGQRREKVATMRWEDIADGVWTLPTEAREKNNPGSLKLSATTLAIIEAQPKIKGCPYVFAGRGNGPFAGFSPAKRKLDKACPLPQWQLHDLRRTAKTLMARAGVRPDISERVLGHVIAGVEGVYDQHDYSPEKADALERLARQIDLILNPPSANVVALGAAQ